MNPFDTYPDNGRKLLGNVTGANCRHEYGLTLQRLTGQRSCAYCDLSLVDTYEHWLMLSVDHVVPRKAGLELGIPAQWLHDYSNLLLCCSACNGFRNRYRVHSDAKAPESLDDFFALRDRIFGERKIAILKCHESERQFFNGRPWER